MIDIDTCNKCDQRKLVINEYDDFVNVCDAYAEKRIDCNIFEERPSWCPCINHEMKIKFKFKYPNNGDGTFTETTEEE